MLDFKIDNFKGPIGLLLELIKKEKMDIVEISLSKIADQYLEYIKNSNNSKPEEMADFLVVAVKLLLIKSKVLLPCSCQEEVEEDMKELEEQLKMYKEFVDASEIIEKIIAKKKFMFARKFKNKIVLKNPDLFFPPKKLKKEHLHLVFLEIVQQIRPINEILEEKILDHKISVEDKIIYIQNLLINKINFNFNQILQKENSKIEIIVSFLAILELVKQRDAFVRQEGLFQEILVRKSINSKNI